MCLIIHIELTVENNICSRNYFFLVIVFGVESGLSTYSFSTWIVDNGLSMQVFFFPSISFKGGIKANSCSQVFDVFPLRIPITFHFYPICFGKCCFPFIYIGGPKGRNFIYQNKTFYFGELLEFHFFGVMG